MTTPPSPPPQSFNILLLEQMDRSFNLEELKDLCLRLGVRYENLGGENLHGRKRELILEMDRKGRLPDLLAFCTHLRPHVSWPSLGTPAVPETAPAIVARIQRNPRQIFLSHASQDGVFAQQLAADLHRHKWVVWMAPDSIRPGEQWVEAINRGLAESGIFVLMLTPEALNSVWVQSETNAAVGFQHQGHMRLIPLELKPVTAPPLWQTYQWIPFQSDYKIGLERLLQALQPEQVAQVAGLYRQFQEAINRRQWERAQELGGQIKGLYPDYRETEALLAVAQREEVQEQALQAEAAVLYPRLQAALATADWATALTLASQIEAVLANYRDVRHLAERARRGQRHSQRQAASQRLRQIPVWGWAGGGVLAVVALLLVWQGGFSPAPTSTPTLAATAIAVEEPTATFTPSPTPTLTPTFTPTPSRTPTPTPTLDPKVPPPNAQLGDEWVRPKDGMVMVFVPAPSQPFELGSGLDAPTEGYWIDKYEVSNAQYELCVTDGVCEPSARADNANLNGAEYPVVGIPWDDAVAYAEWVGAELPTEEQWEYAAAGEEGRAYPWGDEFDGTRLNFCDVNCSSPEKDGTVDDGYPYTAPVGSYPEGASWVGSLDMAGNVWEWTSSPYPDRSFVVRGGSWNNNRFSARVSFRYWSSSRYSYYYLGVRLVRVS